MNAKQFVILALSVILAFFLPECKKNPTVAENEVIFTFTPAGSASQQMTVNFSFHCSDPNGGIPNCNILYFMGDNDDDWMSFPETADATTGCLDFITVVYLPGEEYTFIGQVLPLSVGVVRASGNYQKEINGGIGGMEFGTFTVLCDNIAIGSTLCGQNK